MSGRKAATLLAALASATGALTLSGAAFVASSANPSNTLASASDWTAPTAGAAVIATTSSGAPIGAGGAVRQGGTYRAYANVSDTGNPASGVSTVSADVSSVTHGSSAVALTACTSNCVVDGVTYAYASAEQTASNPVNAGSYGWSVTPTDAAGNSRTDNFTVSVDNTPPSLSTLQMLDADHNGKVDQVQATFNETLATSSATSPWTLTAVPSGGLLSTVGTSGAVATLALAEGSSAADTSVGSFKVALASSSVGVRDNAGNQASFVSQAPADKAAPEVVSINRHSTSPSNASSVQFDVSFSESVTGVGTGDFQAAAGGNVSGASISGVTGSGSSYTVTVATGTGDGTVGLNLVDDDSIADSSANKLGGTGTGNGNLTGQTYTIDKTAPQLSSLQMLDTDHNGKVDSVQATFNEAIQTSTATGPWTLTSVPSSGSLASVSTNGSVATLTLTQGTGAADTSVGNFKVALSASSTGIRDQAGNQASFAATAPSDGAAPEVVSIVKTDADPTNATTLHWTATFSESVIGVDTSDFALAGVSGGSVTSVAGSGTTYTVTASAGSSDGSLGLNLVDDDSIADSSANKLGGTGTGNGNYTGQTYTVDRTPPSLSSLQMLDTDHNGKVDQVQATFNETIQSSTATAPWTLSSVPSGGSLASVSTSGAVATLTLAEGTSSADTSVGNFMVALSASSTGIRDQAGNQASFAARAPTDKAGPVPTAVADTNGATDGKFEQNDTLTISFSEAVTGVGTSSNVVLTGGSGNGTSANDSITVPGVLQLSSLGRSDYISTNGSIANFNSSTLSSPAANQVKVSLGACSDGTSGGCANLTQAAGTGSFSVVPDSTITDAAGNGATGNPTFTIRVF